MKQRTPLLSGMLRIMSEKFPAGNVNKFELMKNVYYIILAVILGIIFGRCETSDICLSNQNAAQTGLYSAYSHTDKDTVLTNLYVLGLGKGDNLLYDSVSLNKLFLPLSMHSDTTAYLIKVKTLLDTIWFVYKRDLSYVSGDCGMAVEIELDTILFTGRFIDSVAIIQPFIKYNENTENIKLYID